MSKKTHEMSAEEIDKLPGYLSGLPTEQPWRERALNAWRDWNGSLPVPQLSIYGPRNTDQQREDSKAYDSAKRREIRGY